MASRLMLRIVVAVIACLAAAGCAREPPEAVLREQVSTALAEEFKAGLFEIASLRRLGSARYRESGTGDRRMTVFFNATLRFTEDFDLTTWDGLNAASLAYLLGATEKGVAGINPNGNQSGDLLRVHGSRDYALRQGQWQPLLVSSRSLARAGQEAAESERLLARIEELAERSADRRGGKEQEIINRELTGSLNRIERALEKEARIFAAASGPPGGAYHRYVQALEDNPRTLGVRVRNYPTEGSVENCQLVAAGSVDIAIAQSNLTAQAVAGTGAFAEKGALPDIRAVSALFPEYLQIVVAGDSDIDTLAGLKGKRIDFGLPASGTRVDALRLLKAAGLSLPDFAEIRESGLEAAVAALTAGELDAFFTTLQAPAKALQGLLASGKGRLLSLPPDVQNAVRAEFPVYRTAVLPARTYPGQEVAVFTLGVTATLIVRADLPDERVTALMEGLFGAVSALGRDNVRVTLLAPETGREGLSIPLHPAAKRFFEGESAPPDDA